MCAVGVLLNRVVRKTFGAASEGGTGDCKHCIMRCFTILVGYKKGVEGKCVHDFGLETGGRDTILNTWA